MQTFQIISDNPLKPFEKKVKAAVINCFRELKEKGFTVEDFKNYMLASAVASSQIEGSTLNLNSFYQSKQNNQIL